MLKKYILTQKLTLMSVLKSFLFVIILLACNDLIAQQRTSFSKSKSDFWNNVQFGGGLGLGFSNNSTTITIAPSAIYNFNKFVSLGSSLQYSYINQKNVYTSNLYGASIIGLLNPIDAIQISAEIEQMRVNTTSSISLTGLNYYPKDNFWNTALFIGAGYRTNNVTIGGRYNVLYKENNGVYGTAFMPFIRVYF